MQTLQRPIKAPIRAIGRGRPTKLHSLPKILLETYLDTRQDTFDIPTRKWTVRLPTVEGFAAYLGVHRSTLYDWAKKDREYDFVLATLVAEQKTRLINGGLAGRYSSWLVIRLLKINHEYRQGH